MMKITVLVLAFVVMGAMARAEVNCDQVRRYAQTGRAPEDIAETMIIDVNEVKKCLQGEGTQATPAAKKAK